MLGKCMPREYFVSKNPSLFVDASCNTDEKSKFISYRMVICHAMHKLMRDQKIEKEKIKSYITELQKFKSQDITNCDFFETRMLAQSQDIVIIDKTEGCYPLVLRAISNDADRVDAFENSITDLTKSFDQIYEIINSRKEKEFDEVTHCKLEKLFNYG